MIALLTKGIQTILAKKLNVKELDMVIVVTNYSNQALVEYIRNLGLKVIITPTGVKYTHATAIKHDIGIYYEANGHGTVFMKNKFLKKIKKLFNFNNQNDVLDWKLLNFFNKETGDAILNLFQIELYLRYLKMSREKFSKIFKPTCIGAVVG